MRNYRRSARFLRQQGLFCDVPVRQPIHENHGSLRQRRCHLPQGDFKGGVPERDRYDQPNGRDVDSGQQEAQGSVDETFAERKYSRSGSSDQNAEKPDQREESREQGAGIRRFVDLQRSGSKTVFRIRLCAGHRLV